MVGIFQQSKGCKNFLFELNQISQFEENVISFDFLANIQYLHHWPNYFNIIDYKVPKHYKESIFLCAFTIRGLVESKHSLFYKRSAFLGCQP